jgi:hypothetical protein
MSFAELFLAGDLLKQEESEGFLAQLDADAAATDAGNKTYTKKLVKW